MLYQRGHWALRGVDYEISHRSKRTIYVGDEFRPLQMVSKLDTGLGSVLVRMLVLKRVDYKMSHQLERRTSGVSEDVGLPRGWIVRSHLS